MTLGIVVYFFTAWVLFVCPVSSVEAKVTVMKSVIIF